MLRRYHGGKVGFIHLTRDESQQLGNCKRVSDYWSLLWTIELSDRRCGRRVLIDCQFDGGGGLHLGVESIGNSELSPLLPDWLRDDQLLVCPGKGKQPKI